MRAVPFLLVLSLLLASLFGACSDDTPPTGEAIATRDSLPVMVTTGVSKLISDSGVIRYRIVAEEWRMLDRTKPPRQEFVKGIFMERYDAKFKPNLTIQADTAYCYDQKLWELRGRVRIVNREKGTVFTTEELFWNMSDHLLYGSKHMRIVEPDQEIEGDSFEADEQLNHYLVRQSRGFMPMPDERKQPPHDPRDLEREPGDTAK
ncbi:MAG: LPS export ABC transporter periplasmic protein LptC [Bacteroidaceae bacterium]|nr:LPS export ABC transporter periplasmic protein LptC [Bacteroidaceae bacterium]